MKKPEGYPGLAKVEFVKSGHRLFEAQFLTPFVIDQLREIATNGVPVMCYGLRTDFTRKLFPGSMRLMELADSIEEIKTTCFYCDRKAIFSIRLVDGVPVGDGPVVKLGGKDSYVPACSACYRDKVPG